jgi:hypothetical protein
MEKDNPFTSDKKSIVAAGNQDYMLRRKVIA